MVFFSKFHSQWWRLADPSYWSRGSCPLLCSPDIKYIWMLHSLEVKSCSSTTPLHSHHLLGIICSSPAFLTPRPSSKSKRGHAGSATSGVDEENRWRDTEDMGEEPEPFQFLPTRPAGATFDTTTSWTPLSLVFGPSVISTLIANPAKKNSIGDEVHLERGNSERLLHFPRYHLLGPCQCSLSPVIRWHMTWFELIWSNQMWSAPQQPWRWRGKQQ